MRSVFTDEFLAALDRWDGVVAGPCKDSKKHKSLRVFNNHFIETYLAKAHPIFPGIWSIPLVIALLWYAISAAALGPVKVAAAFVLGVLSWSLLEYCLHRFLFHRVPKDRFFDRVGQYMMHGYHHEYPDDPGRLVAPALLAWPIAVPVAGLWYLVAGIWWLPLFAGTVAGYLAYDWVHWYTHHVVPSSSLGRWLRRLHAIHHYKEFQLNMGISSPLWDLLLGTYTYTRRKAPTPADAEAK